MEANRPCDRAPSVMVAALGPQLLRIAGRRTDGTLSRRSSPICFAAGALRRRVSADEREHEQRRSRQRAQRHHRACSASAACCSGIGSTLTPTTFELTDARPSPEAYSL